MAADRNATGVPGIERLLALSDGVVAIALTLLVLQLAVPMVADAGSPSQLAHKLGSMRDQFSSYLIAFYVIAQYWLVHHRVFRTVSGHDESLAWWNFAFLLTITLVPFTSALLGKYADNPLGVDLFNFNLLLVTFTTTAVPFVARRKVMVIPTVPHEVFRVGQIRALAVTIVVVASAAVAWVSTDAARYLWILLVLAPGMAQRLAVQG